MAKIIFFEPDETLANLYISKFQKKGIDILHLGNPPKDFVQFITKEKPDLILTDIIIPEIDWHRFICSLNFNKNTKNIPVIVLTNIDNQDDKNTAFHLGVADYLVRAEYSPSEAVNKIIMFLNNRNKKNIFMDNQFLKFTTKKKKLLLIILIGVAIYLFYWFEWRPVSIRKECYKETITNDRYYCNDGDDWKYGSCENYFNMCLIKYGINK